MGFTRGNSISRSSNSQRPDFSCRLCDGNNLRLYYTLGNDEQFRYYKCGHCELVNLDLANGLDQTQCHVDFRDPTNESAGWDKMLDETFASIRQLVPEADSLCDIGCGNGRLLYLAKQAGWRVLGLELTEDVAERTGRHLDVKVVAADFLEFEPSTEESEAFDVVCLRHVLEHLPDSKLAMRKIRSLLKPGGHALLEFPNVEALDKRVKRSLVNAGLHRRKFKDGFMPGHCNEFCRESFEFLVNETGFRLVKWETYSKRPIANWIYNRLPIGDKSRTLIQRLA